MQKARGHRSRGSHSLQAHGFRSSFTPLSAVLFTFPSRYLSAIGLPGVFSLGGWCRLLQAGFLRSRPTQGLPSAPRLGFRIRGSHPLRRAFPGAFRYPAAAPRRGPYNPARALTRPVWALPLSLTTTRGITVVFSSSAYLDVSVRRVRLPIRGWQASCLPGCPIRISADRSPLAAPRGFSQPVASFFASGSLGIHRAPFPASPHNGVPAAMSAPRVSCALCPPPQRSRARRLFLSFHRCQRTSALWRIVENKGLEPLTPSLQS